MAIVFRNATWSAAVTAVRAACGLANALLAVRILGAQNYGYVATSLSLFVIYVALNSSIFTVLVSKLISADASDEQATRSALQGGAALLAAASVFLLVAVTLALRELAPQIILVRTPDDGLRDEFDGVIPALGILTAFQIVGAYNAAIVESAGRLDAAMKAQVIGPVTVLALLAALLAIGVRATPTEYVAVLGIGALADLFILRLVKARVASRSVSIRLSREHVEGLVKLVRSGGPLQAASLMNFFLEPLNKMLLNYFSGPLAVTVYDLAMKVIWGIQSMFNGGMRVFLHLAAQDGAAVPKVFSRVLDLIGRPVVAIHTLSALFLTWMAHYWVEISPGDLMVFFSIATVSNVGMILVTPLYLSLIGRGEYGFIFRAHLILAITNLGVSLALVPRMGLLGAGVGLLCASCYNLVAIYRKYREVLGVDGGTFVSVSESAKRYAVVTSLFLVTVLHGAADEPDVYVSISILIVLAAIMVREPFVSLLLERSGLRK